MSKPKPGRPRLKDGENTRQVRVRFASSDLEKVIDAALRDDITFGGYASPGLWIRKIILRELSKGTAFASDNG